MPNWSDCYIKFRGKKEVIDEIVKNVENYGYDWGKTKMPLIFSSYSSPLYSVSSEEWKEFAKKCRAGEESPPFSIIKENLKKRLVEKYGANDWHDWAIKNWGTKWNMDEGENIPINYECYDFDGEKYVEVEYSISGAWTGATKWFSKLCEEYKLSGEFIDAEPGVDFFTKISYIDGKEAEFIFTNFFSKETLEHYGLNYLIDIYENTLIEEDRETFEELKQNFLDISKGTKYEKDVKSWLKEIEKIIDKEEEDEWIKIDNANNKVNRGLKF